MEKTSEQPLSESITAFLDFVRTNTHDHEQHASLESNDTPIFLGQMTEQAGHIYEKIRSAVDNKEEHFLRRYAIRRIAKRILWFAEDPRVITGRLLRELYLGGYLPGTSISRHTEEDVVHKVSAFLSFSRHVETGVPVGEVFALRSDLLDIFAGELEDEIYQTQYEEASVRLLARIADETVDATQFGDVALETRHILCYIASWRALFGADNALLTFKLWRYWNPGWENSDDATTKERARNFREFLRSRDSYLEHPLGKRLVPRLRNDAIATSVLYRLLKRFGPGLETLMQSRNDFQTRVRELVVGKYREDITRASRRAFHAIVYIFSTKALLVLLVESVNLSLLGGTLDPIIIGINVLFHPLLLFILTTGIFPPQKGNTERLLVLVDGIVYGGIQKEIAVHPKSRGFISDVVFVVYFTGFVTMMSAITSLLVFLHFHVVDIVLFLFFFMLVLYFGFRIRFGARSMELSGVKEGFFRSLFETLALPVISVGRFMVLKFERLNFIAMFMDFFIEMPFKLILQFFELFSKALKEKKEEIYS